MSSNDTEGQAIFGIQSRPNILCINFIKFDSVQMASSLVDLPGNGFVLLNINLHNLCPVQIKVLMICLVCCS